MWLIITYLLQGCLCRYLLAVKSEMNGVQRSDWSCERFKAGVNREHEVRMQRFTQGKGFAGHALLGLCVSQA